VRGTRLLIATVGPDAIAIERALGWLADRCAAGRHGVVLLPTLAALDDGGVLAVAIGAKAVEIARRERRLVIEVEGRRHPVEVRTEQTFKTFEYRLVVPALVGLWASDALLRRVNRDLARADMLAVSWTHAQTGRWIARFGFVPVGAAGSIVADQHRRDHDLG
jgi:hypothetical protein